MKTDVTELKARFSLETMFERDGHKLINASGLKKCLCPFHKEKSPSCCVYPDGHFYCFGCGKNGSVIDYVMHRDGTGFKAAIEKLSGNAPVERFDTKLFLGQIQRHQTPPLPNANGLIQEWKRETDIDDLGLFAFELQVSEHSLMTLGCVWANPHHAWAFPMRSATGETVGIRLRDRTGHKWAVKGSKEGLFFGFVEQGKTLVIAEGPTDTAAGITLGLNIAGRPSCNGAVAETVKLIERTNAREVVIISDNDAPGLAGSDRLEQHLPCPYRELVLPCKDLREFLKLGGTKQLLESMAAKQIPGKKPSK